MPAKLLVTALAVALVVAGGVVAVDAGVSETGDTRTFSEQLTSPTAGSEIVLNQSELDSVRYVPADVLNVTNDNGTFMIPGEDYAYDRTNGTITPLAGGRLAGSGGGAVDYGFRVTTGQQDDAAEFAGSTTDVATAVMFVTVIGFVVAGLLSFRRI